MSIQRQKLHFDIASFMTILVLYNSSDCKSYDTAVATKSTHTLLFFSVSLPSGKILAVQAEKVVTEYPGYFHEVSRIDGFTVQYLVDVGTATRQLPCEPHLRFYFLFEFLSYHEADICHCL